MDGSLAPRTRPNVIRHTAARIDYHRSIGGNLGGAQSGADQPAHHQCYLRFDAIIPTADFSWNTPRNISYDIPGRAARTLIERRGTMGIYILIPALLLYALMAFLPVMIESPRKKPEA